MCVCACVFVCVCACKFVCVAGWVSGCMLALLFCFVLFCMVLVSTQDGIVGFGRPIPCLRSLPKVAFKVVLVWV